MFVAKSRSGAPTMKIRLLINETDVAKNLGADEAPLAKKIRHFCP